MRTNEKVESSFNMSCWQKTKLIVPILLFNILLPTWDVFSDVMLSVKLIIGGNQSCLREEENVQEFRYELDLCLKNPQEYCQGGDSVASYMCQANSTNPSCLKCPSASSNLARTDDCSNTNEGITEIYHQCLKNNDYCRNPKTYHGICEEGTRKHFKVSIILLGIR